MTDGPCRRVHFPCLPVPRNPKCNFLAIELVEFSKKSLG